MSYRSSTFTSGASNQCVRDLFNFSCLGQAGLSTLRYPSSTTRQDLSRLRGVLVHLLHQSLDVWEPQFVAQALDEIHVQILAVKIARVVEDVCLEEQFRTVHCRSRTQARHRSSDQQSRT